MHSKLPLVAFALPALAAWWLLRRQKWREQREARGAGLPAQSPAVAAAATAAPAVHPHAETIAQLSRQPPLLQLPPRPEPAGPLGSGKSEYIWVARPSHLAAAAAELFEQDRIAL